MINFSGINYPGVVVSTIIYYLIGFICYTFLLGAVWREQKGVPVASQTKPTIRILPGQFISTFMYAFGIAVILQFFGTYGITEGILVSDP
jgi:hypothetical protein